MSKNRPVPFPKPWIKTDTPRIKNPKFDLKRNYHRAFGISTVLSTVLLTGIAVAIPEFTYSKLEGKRTQSVLQIEQIPETRQVKRSPPPPRPSVPIETESADVPDDVTIESTDLEFDEIPLDLPPPPPPGEYESDDAVEGEIMDFWAVETHPVLLKQATLVYPEVAVKAGLEGLVFVEFVVGRDGKARQIKILRGPEIFRDSALEAVGKFVFKPAMQNDKPVSVRMSQLIRFKLNDGG